MKKILFLDVETTGLDAKKHGIVQLSAIMDIDGQVADRFDIKIHPHSSCACDTKALEISGNTVEQILTYTPEGEAFNLFVRFLGKHIDKFAAYDKAAFCGYNAPFDNEFVRQLFQRNGDNFFGSWFWSGTIDVMGLSLLRMLDERHAMPNFKLGTVADVILGADRVNEMTVEFGLHNAMTDIEITREIFLKVTK